MRPLLALAAALALSACATTAPPTGPAPPVEDDAPAYPAYETFDPSGYDAEPDVRTDVDHDVPARVMAGRVVVPGGAAPAPAPADDEPREVDGYRVQVFSSNSRDSAERVRAQALSWWQGGARDRAGAPASLDARVVYLQPYYRVRLGAFATREEADAALRLVRDEFPEAFLVADRVTVGG